MNNKFFCVCPKCNTKIYEHIGMHEFPPGKHVLDVECQKCNHKFQHAIWSASAAMAAKVEETKKKMKFMTSSTGIKTMTNIVKKAMGIDTEPKSFKVKKGDHEGDDNVSD